jgi:hypothetical protein
LAGESRKMRVTALSETPAQEDAADGESGTH